MLATTLVFCGCSHQLSPRARDAAYRQIQIHEAAVARTQQDISHTAKSDARRHADVDALCASSRALCAQGDAVDERDATERCARARDVCGAERAALAAPAGGGR